MRRFLLLFILLVVGCSSSHFINCSYVDYSSTYGTRSVVDKLVFSNDSLVSFERNINMSINDNVSVKSVYRSFKLEGKSFKKLVNGKYKLNRSDNSVNLILRTKYVQNLSYIGISNDSYDNIKNYYSSIGFSCK